MIACQIHDVRRGGAVVPRAWEHSVLPDIRVILVIATATPSMDKARHVRN